MLITRRSGPSSSGCRRRWTNSSQRESVRGESLGGAQFGSTFFMIPVSRLAVSAGVIYLSVVAAESGEDLRPQGSYEDRRITGLYWHFVDLVGDHVRILLSMVEGTMATTAADTNCGGARQIPSCIWWDLGLRLFQQVLLFVDYFTDTGL